MVTATYVTFVAAACFHDARFGRTLICALGSNLTYMRSPLTVHGIEAALTTSMLHYTHGNRQTDCGQKTPREWIICLGKFSRSTSPTRQPKWKFRKVVSSSSTS